MKKILRRILKNIYNYNIDELQDNQPNSKVNSDEMENVNIGI